MRFLNIRAKMASLIVSLVVIIGVAILQAISMLSAVEEKLERLDDSTAAAIEANGVIARKDEEMADLISRVRLALDRGAVDALAAEFNTTFDQTTDVVSQLPIERDAQVRLTSQLELFASRMNRLIDARRQMIAASDEFSEGLADLSTMMHRIETLLGNLISREMAEIDTSDGTAAAVARSTALVRLKGQFDLLKSRTSDLADVDGAGRRNIVLEMRSRLGDLIRATALSRDSQASRDLAGAMVELSDMILPEGPLERLITRMESEERALAAALSDVNEARRAVDRLTAETVEATGVAIREGRRMVFAEEGETRRAQAVVLAGVLFFVLLLVWWVTDRRIVRRIERLTDEMSRVAAGDLDAPISLVGQDEIGRMAEALGVFRVNAIELKRSNAELANFAYAASHDLRSPLRAIRNLVDWTIEDAGDQLPEDIQGNLEMIRARADRLSRLLTDLLDYARAGSVELRPEVVHLPGMTRDIADIVDPDRRFEITFSGARCITTAITPLRTILMNLVSNAIKHHDSDEGRVEIVHEITGDRSTILVRDDGPGVPLQYQEKVFELFQTLKSSDDVEGSGMGLAMVRKLVTELGGEIELRSMQDEERGATFIITLPVLDMVELDPPVDGTGEEGRAA